MTAHAECHLVRQGASVSPILAPSPCSGNVGADAPNIYILPRTYLLYWLQSKGDQNNRLSLCHNFCLSYEKSVCIVAILTYKCTIIVHL